MIHVKRWLQLFGDRFEAKYMILLVLAVLHKEKKITDAKLKGQLQALRKGTLQKKRRLFHCGINDSWYEDEPVLSLYKEVANDKNVSSILYKEFIEYINLLENKGHNHALNVFGSEYIYPIFNSWNPEYNSSFSDYLGFMIPDVKANIHKSHCYECGHEHISVDKEEKRNLEVIEQWIHQQKKGNLSKIPLHHINRSTWWPY